MGAKCNGDTNCCCAQNEFCSTFVTGQGGPGECQGSVASPVGNPIITKTRGTNRGSTNYRARGQKQAFRNFEGGSKWGGFADNSEEFYQWSNDSENDKYLQGNSYQYAINNSNLEWNNATGQYNEHQGYMNAAGGGPCSCGKPSCSFMTSANDCYDCCNTNDRRRRGPKHLMSSLGDWRSAGGDPSINVGGETFDMQPTLAWNQGDFFGQPQGFGAGNLVCEPCPPRFKGTRQACGGTGCYNRLGQRLGEAGTGIPQGMGVQYTQI
tara:strand:- start:4305 stop:5102 length:798 start_codon:yes stop_codon:yes gene_type:complete